MYDDDSLESQFNFIKNTENLIWFATEFLHTVDGKNFNRHIVPKYNNLIWTGTNMIGCPSVITIKNENLIFFDEGLNWLMDCDYYKKMYDNFGEPKILNKISVAIRTSGGRLSNTISQELKDKEIEFIHQRYTY